MIRSQLAEYGIALAKGVHHAHRLIDELVDGVAPDIPALACKLIVALAEQVRDLQSRIVMFEGEIRSWFRGNDLARRLETIPGIGYITASALAAAGLAEGEPATLAAIDALFALPYQAHCPDNF